MLWPLLAFTQAWDSLRNCASSGNGIESWSCKEALASEFLEIPEFDSSLYYSRLVQDNYDAYKDSGMFIHALKLEGLAQQYQGNYEESIRIFHETGEYYKRNDLDIFYENQMDIGLVYIRMEAWDKAGDYVKDCLDHADRISRRAYGNALNCYGIVHYFEDQIDSAVFYYKASAKVMEEENNLRGAVLAYTNIGAVFSEEIINYDSAHFYFQIGQELAQKGNYAKELVGLLINEGVAWEMEEQYEKAISNYKKGLEVAEKHGAYVNLRYALFNLADVYGNKLNQPGKAFPYLQRYSQLKDSVYQKEKLQAIDEINTKYETAEKERIIALTEKKLARRQLYLSIALGAVGILLLLGLLLWYRGRTRVQQARIEEQERGLHAVIKATENERRRIARDLHDGVGQELGILSLGFEKIKKEVAPEQQDLLTPLRDQIQNTARQVREISHTMMPRALEKAGLVPALEALVEQSFAHSDITAHFDALRVPENISPEVSLALYRVAQELLSNAVKHAGASQIDLLLTGSKNGLSLSVEDNGKGFKQDEESDGIGLANMRARLNTIGGSLRYEPGGNGGTRAVVTSKSEV